MPSIRIGFSTDFSLTSEQVGIGTTLPSARLDVAGQILSDNSSGSGGVSTVTRYDGFLGSEQRVTSNISIAQTTKGNLNSLSGEIVIEDEVTGTDDTPLTGGRLDSLSVTGKFDLPQGGSEDREDTPEKGSTRFNQDLGQLEFYTGYEWRTVNSYAGSGRGRGVFYSGSGPGAETSIRFVNIHTLGNSEFFGLVGTNAQGTHRHGASSSTRGLFGGGYFNTPGGVGNIIEYITIASAGNAIDFGDLTQGRNTTSSLSSSTRGIWAGGDNIGTVNTIDYVQIATIGNALDFGDLSIKKSDITAGCSSPVRGIIAGGSPNGTSNLSSIDFISISSLGNSVYFGDLTVARMRSASSSNSVRGLFFNGGYTGSPINFKTIDYVTIASTGNAVNFGDTAFVCTNRNSCSTSTRSVIAGGCIGPSTVGINTIEYVTIMTTGNSMDFGDLTSTLGNRAVGSCSDSHGGLGGF